jgi:two-component system chemotaxis response regulator CheB
VAQTESPPVRVLIVDDSALMRKLLGGLLDSAPEVEVVGTASDGDQAIELAKKLRPDVVTLDVEMPGRNGLDVLPDLLAVGDLAVIMVSVFTKEGADTTLTALERGAVDFFPKPDRHQFAQIREARDILVAKVLGAASTRRPHRRGDAPARPALRVGTGSASGSALSKLVREGSAADFKLEGCVPVRCIVVGISTGGPQALGRVLPLVAPPMPPILIVQHMPAQFTGVFAERLDRACSLDVKEAEEGDRLLPNRVLVAPGGKHMQVFGLAAAARVMLTQTLPVSGHRPSVDVLFTSAAKVFQGSTAAIIMTGMGRDGVDGCRVVKAHGGLTFGQDEASSVVYGMNKAAQLEGVVGQQFALDQFPALVRKLYPEK